MALSFSSGRRRRRVLVYQTGQSSTAAAASPVLPPRTVLARPVRQRWIQPRITITHTTNTNASHHGARPYIAVGRAPQPRRITSPRVYHTTSLPNQPLPQRILPRPLVVHRLDRLTRSRPIVVYSGHALVPSAIAPRPAIVVQVRGPRRWPAPVIIKKIHARQSIQAVPVPQVRRPPIVPPARRSPIVLTSPRGAAQIPRPKPVVLPNHLIIVRRPPALPWKLYQTSVFGDRIARMPRPPKVLVVGRPRPPVRPTVITQLDSGVGRVVRPVRPQVVRPPVRIVLPTRLIKPALHHLLASPARQDPRSLIGVFGRRRGAGSIETPSSAQSYRRIVIAPPQVVQQVNPPTTGVPNLPPDLIAACIAWLRLQAPIVAAFGDAVGSEKFGSDIAAGGTQPPYLEFNEPEEDEGYETEDQTGLPSSLAEGVFYAELVGSQAMGKLGTRQLAEQVVAVLNDAPLTFLDGVLVYLRRSKRRYPTFKSYGPGSNIVTWKRVLEFEYKIERYVT
jgi:hypothetical protein